MPKIARLIIKLNIVGWEETLLAIVLSKPPVLIWEFLNTCVSSSEPVIHDIEQTALTTLVIFAPSGKLNSLPSAAS
jgi:hypothetical protein